MTKPFAPSRTEVQTLYEDIPKIYATSDRWHTVTHRWIARIVRTEMERVVLESAGLIANLGSGGESYGLAEDHLLHVDLCTKWARSDQYYVVGDIHDIPLKDHSCIACICVGSVLNHCDASRVIYEIDRVLMPGGILIVEFESTSGLDMLLSPVYGAAVGMAWTFYNGRQVRLAMYAEQYVAQIIRASEMQILRRGTKHHLSGFVYFLSRNPNLAARFHLFDGIFAKIPFLRSMASHVILTCQKKLCNEV